MACVGLAADGMRIKENGAAFAAPLSVVLYRPLDLGVRCEDGFDLRGAQGLYLL